MKPKFLTLYKTWLDQHYSQATAYRYKLYALKLIRFHGCKIHPEQMSQGHVNQFLAQYTDYSASTKTQVDAAMVALFSTYLKVDWYKAYKPRQGDKFQSCQLSDDLAMAIIAKLSGESKTAMSLVYGAGLRLADVMGLECSQFDFERGLIDQGAYQAVLPLALTDTLKAKCQLSDGGRVFKVSKGTVERHLKHIVSELGHSTITPGDFRGAYIVCLIRSGANDAQIADVTGLGAHQIGRYKRRAGRSVVGVKSPLDDVIQSKKG